MFSLLGHVFLSVIRWL